MLQRKDVLQAPVASTARADATSENPAQVQLKESIANLPWPEQVTALTPALPIDYSSSGVTASKDPVQLSVAVVQMAEMAYPPRDHAVQLSKDRGVNRHRVAAGPVQETNSSWGSQNFCQTVGNCNAVQLQSLSASTDECPSSTENESAPPYLTEEQVESQCTSYNPLVCSAIQLLARHENSTYRNTAIYLIQNPVPFYFFNQLQEILRLVPYTYYYHPIDSTQNIRVLDGTTCGTVSGIIVCRRDIDVGNLALNLVHEVNHILNPRSPGCGDEISANSSVDCVIELYQSEYRAYWAEYPPEMRDQETIKNIILNGYPEIGDRYRNGDPAIIAAVDSYVCPEGNLTNEMPNEP